MDAHQRPSEAPEDLFEKVVAELGLSMIIGPGLVKRALLTVGADPASATRTNYADCLPMLQQRLVAYMATDVAAARIAAVRRLLQPSK